MGKLDPNRPINLHGQVKKKGSYKSYRPEATPGRNIIVQFILALIVGQAAAFGKTGAFVPFSSIWAWPGVLALIALHLFIWIKFKSESHEK